MTNTATSQERRQFSRVPFEASVSISNPSGSWTGKLKDISLNGVLISLPQNWHSSENKQYLIEVHPAGNTFLIRMEVTAIHKDTQAIGFQCNHIDIDSISHLRRLIELNIGDEKLLNRELTALISDAA